jgi:S1-C subfamily serine protease
MKGETLVDAVDEGSPAAAAGIQSRDILLMVNGQKVNNISLFVLREQFCSEGKHCRLVVRRGTQQREVSFILPKTE